MNKFIKHFSKKTPFSVTLIGGIALTLTALNAIRFGIALAQWQDILDFMPHPGPLYIALTGLFWTLVWGVVYLSFDFGWNWGRVIILIASPLYAIYYWLDRLFFQNAVERTNTKFALIITLTFFLIVVIIVFLPSTRKYFAGEYGEEEESGA